jgi:hypothetical protein
MQSVHLWMPQNPVSLWWGNSGWSYILLILNWNLGCVGGMFWFERNVHQNVTLKRFRKNAHKHTDPDSHVCWRGRMSKYSQKWTLEGSSEETTEMLWTTAEAAL